MGNKLETLKERLFKPISDYEQNKKSSGNKSITKTLSKNVSSIPTVLGKAIKTYPQYVKENLKDWKELVTYSLFSQLHDLPFSAIIYSTGIASYLSGNELLHIAFAAYLGTRIPIGIWEEYMVRKQRKENKTPLTADTCSSVFGPMTKLGWDIGTKSLGLLSGNPGLVAAASVKTYADIISNGPRFVKNLEIMVGRKLELDQRLKGFYEKSGQKLQGIYSTDKHSITDCRNVVDYNSCLGVKQTGISVPYLFGFHLI